MYKKSCRCSELCYLSLRGSPCSLIGTVMGDRTHFNPISDQTDIRVFQSLLSSVYLWFTPSLGCSPLVTSNLWRVPLPWQVLNSKFFSLQYYRTSENSSLLFSDFLLDLLTHWPLWLKNLANVLSQKSTGCQANFSVLHLWDIGTLAAPNSLSLWDFWKFCSFLYLLMENLVQISQFLALH